MYRPAWFEKASRGRSVVAIALDLHCSVIGSSDYATEREMADDIACLREVRDNWKPTVIPEAKAFDDAVLAMVNAALAASKSEVGV